MTSAPGATTVPMSRPSATQSPLANSRRCSATIAPRTAGSAAAREAASETPGVRISVGHITAVEPHALAELDPHRRRDRAAGATSRCAAASATHRYIAPESR